MKSDTQYIDKYKFSFTHEEVVGILKGEYESIDDHLANEILLNITSIDSRNIRVLKRAITKFTRIKSEITKIEGVILEQALSKVMSEIIRICCAKFEYGFSKERIIDAIESRVIRQMEKDSEKVENSEYEKLDSIFSDSFYGINEKLMSYCCDGLFEFENLKEELNLPIKKTLLDGMKSPWIRNQLTEEDFKSGVVLLENFISTTTDLDACEWFSICDTYIYMLDNQIIDSLKYTKVDLLDICKNVDIDCFAVPVVKDVFGHEFQTHFYDQEVSKEYYSKKSELNTLAKEHKNSDFSQRFLESWNNVQNESHQNLMHTPIYQGISVKLIEDALLSWCNEEVFQFVRFNKNRYKFGNIQDFFESEIEALKTISSMLVTLRSQLGFGLKVASLNELHDCFVDAYSRMETNLGRTEVTENAS